MVFGVFPNRMSTVHLHGRGDNRGVPAGVAAACGSPPRAWGQYETVVQMLARSRFTPTGVGTMLSSFLTTVFPRFTPTGVGTISSDL